MDINQMVKYKELVKELKVEDGKLIEVERVKK